MSQISENSAMNAYIPFPQTQQLTRFFHIYFNYACLFSFSLLKYFQENPRHVISLQHILVPKI